MKSEARRPKAERRPSSEIRRPKPEAEGDSGFGLRVSAFGFNPLCALGSANLSLTPRFSGVPSGAGDMEAVSTVSIPLPTVLVSLHQEMGHLLVGDREP